MTEVRGCNLPEDLYYLVEKHVWAKPLEDGTLRIGMTAVAAKLAGSNLAGVTVKAKNIGKEIAQGKSVATVESSKFVGPVPAPVTGCWYAATKRWLPTPTSFRATLTAKAGSRRSSPPTGKPIKARLPPARTASPPTRQSSKPTTFPVHSFVTSKESRSSTSGGALRK